MNTVVPLPRPLAAESHVPPSSEIGRLKRNIPHEAASAHPVVGQILGAVKIILAAVQTQRDNIPRGRAQRQLAVQIIKIKTGFKLRLLRSADSPRPPILEGPPVAPAPSSR
jgi:hypothetical protein